LPETPAPDRGPPIGPVPGWSASWPQTRSPARSLDPYLGRHDRPLSGLGDDHELVHQPPHAGQAEPQAAGRRVAALHGEVDVGDAGAVVLRRHGDPRPAVLLEAAEDDLAAPRVQDDVARQLGDGRGDQGEIAAREADLGRQGPTPLTSGQDVDIRTDRHAVLVDQARTIPPADVRDRSTRLGFHRALAPGAPRPSSSIWSSKARPSSRSRAVATPSSVRPSCTIVNATPGWKPTITVFPPRSRI